MRIFNSVTGLFLCLTIQPLTADAVHPLQFGGCCDPCVTSHCGACSPCEPLDPGPIQALKIVMVPEYGTEIRSICCTEYRTETRQRTYTVYKTVPVEEERIATTVEWVPRTETKTLEYTVSVPIQREETRELSKTVPMWTDVEEKYTVKVPVLREVEEEYTVQVPELKDVEFRYIVQVPQPVTRTIERTLTNIIPVTKIRTVVQSLPETRTELIRRDCGHWENRFFEIPYFGGATKTVCKRVWVPKIVDEEVPVLVHANKTQEIKYTAYEQRSTKVPLDCTHICYSPEERVAMRKQVVYRTEVHTRPRKVAFYQDEERTRIKKLLQFREEVSSTTFPVISYAKEVRTKQVTYTVKVPETKLKSYTVIRYDRVPEEKIETYTVNVPVSVIKDVEVQVCKMVPKVVTIYIDPCANCLNGHGPH